MEDQNRYEILQLLDEGMSQLLGSLEGVDPDSAARRPQPQQWSIVDCVEHLAASESTLLGLLKVATPCEESHEDRAREAKFQVLALNRERRIEAPEMVKPPGVCRSLAEALQSFQAVRHETVDFVGQFRGDFRWSLAQHPMITRPVNCYEMLLLIALHPRRHAQQIAHTRALIAAVP